MLLSVNTLFERHLSDMDVSDTALAQRAEGILAALEQSAAVWMGFPAAPEAPAGALVHATWEERDYVLFPKARDRGARLVLPLAPVSDISEIYSSARASWPADGSPGSDALEVSASDYSIEPLQTHTVLHRLDTASTSIWLSRPRGTRVVCTAGYATEADLPTGVADALYLAVADRIRGAATRALASSSQGGSSQSLREVKDLPMDVQLLLAPYRLLGRLGAA